MVDPNLSVAALNAAVLACFGDAGLWEPRGRIGGGERGIAFPPGRTGHSVSDPDVDPDGGGHSRPTLQ